jgi:integrase
VGDGDERREVRTPTTTERTELRIPTADETRMILGAVAGSCAEGPTVLARGAAWGSVSRWRSDGPKSIFERARLRVIATMYRGGRTEPKTAKARRTVAVPGFVVSWLREHLAAQAERRLASVAWLDDGYVFDRGAGVPMSVETVSRRFGQLAEGIGLGDVWLHDLRHAYATRLLESGVHPKVVSEALGHASVGITLDVYVLPSMSRTAADAIEAVFGAE